MLTRHCELASVKKFQTGDQQTMTKPQKHQNGEIRHATTTINQIESLNIS